LQVRRKSFEENWRRREGSPEKLRLLYLFNDQTHFWPFNRWRYNSLWQFWQFYSVEKSFS
jgi:hypothetical protein